MIIERIQVEEGFLDGLDLAFSPGLNVLIGPRGTGKTSIIELIRFCLDVPGHTDRSENSGHQHALSVLGAGEVTVTLRDGTERIRVARTSEDKAPRKSGEYSLPIIFSQNEIETVGLEARGRLRMVDAFRGNRHELEHREKAFLSQLSSIAVELRDLNQEIQNLRNETATLEGIPKELAEAEKAQGEVLKSMKASTASQAKLQNLSKNLAQYSVSNVIYERSIDAVQGWMKRLSDAAAAMPSLEHWPDASASTDPLSSIRLEIAKSAESVNAAIERTKALIPELRTLQAKNNESRLQADEQARSLRRELEKMQEGAGAITRRVTELRERSGQLQRDRCRA